VFECPFNGDRFKARSSYRLQSHRVYLRPRFSGDSPAATAIIRPPGEIHPKLQFQGTIALLARAAACKFSLDGDQVALACSPRALSNFKRLHV
jgi:hypothetical protein